MEKQNKNTAARIAANNRYNEKNYDRINIAVKKGAKDVIQSAAAAKGETINGYIKNAIKAKIKADTGNDIEL